MSNKTEQIENKVSEIIKDYKTKTTQFKTQTRISSNERKYMLQGLKNLLHFHSRATKENKMRRQVNEIIK